MNAIDVPPPIAEVLAGRSRWATLQGDGLDVLRRLPDGVVDAVVTDPPYCSTGESTAFVSSKARSVPPETQFYEAWFREHLAQWRRVLRPTGAIWCTLDFNGVVALRDACYRLGMAPPTRGIWNRGGLGMGFVLRHVYEFFCVVPMEAWVRRKLDEPDLWECEWHPTDRKHDHSAEKPIPLYERALSLICDPDAVVLDPFQGSGTTGCAALRTGRRYIGVERDEVFAATARDRLAADEAGSTMAAARAGQYPLFKTESST